MIKDILYAVSLAVIAGAITKFVSWFAIQWAMGRFPQEQVISWISLAISFLVTIFVFSKAFDAFTAKDDEDDEDEEED